MQKLPSSSQFVPNSPTKNFPPLLFPLTAPCGLEILAACKSNSEATEFCLEVMLFLFIYFCKKKKKFDKSMIYQL